MPQGPDVNGIARCSNQQRVSRTEFVVDASTEEASKTEENSGDDIDIVYDGDLGRIAASRTQPQHSRVHTRAAEDDDTQDKGLDERASQDAG